MFGLRYEIDYHEGCVVCAGWICRPLDYFFETSSEGNMVWEQGNMVVFSLHMLQTKCKKDEKIMIDFFVTLGQHATDTTSSFSYTAYV